MIHTSAGSPGTEDIVSHESDPLEQLYDDETFSRRLQTDKPRLLIVEDDVHQRAYYGAVLRRAGYRTVEAADGKEALRMVKEGPFACIICDLFMPEMDGAEFVAHLKKIPRYRKVPVIMMTAGDSDLEMNTLEVGADMFFQKNGPLRKLIEEIEMLLW